PHQLHRLREEVRVGARELLDIRVPDGQVTEAGVGANVSVALQYLDSWLQGTGAAAIANLMEDTATAEISRAPLWQWARHRCGRPSWWSIPWRAAGRSGCGRCCSASRTSRRSAP